MQQTCFPRHASGSGTDLGYTPCQDMSLQWSPTAHVMKSKFFSLKLINLCQTPFPHQFLLPHPTLAVLQPSTFQPQSTEPGGDYTSLFLNG